MNAIAAGLSDGRHSSATRYSAVQIALHWLVVLLIAEPCVTSAAVTGTRAPLARPDGCKVGEAR